MPEKSKALVLLNLGTPDSPEPSDVRKYLAEFLMDPYVVDILRDIPWPWPWLARAALVYGSILPVRPGKSSQAYKKIWSQRGSPLLFHLNDLSAKLAALLPDYRVIPAMRYGRPSIRSALGILRDEGFREITVFPLYPQYSLAATESSVAKVREEAGKIGLNADFRFVPAFYDSPAFVRAFARAARASLEGFEADHVLFSFHGLPERQVRKTDPSGAHCLPGDSKAYGTCCERVGEANRDCYRAQSFATAHAIARELGFAPGEFGRRYGISFQSRLGRTPWIRPYTDFTLPELAKAGVKRVAVICPSFVADCLETLEEIGIRGREQFRAAGGIELRLVPSLNSNDDWAETVRGLVARSQEGRLEGRPAETLTEIGEGNRRGS